MGSRRDRALRSQEKGLKVGYHAPPPESHSGVADYAERLKPALAQYCEIEDGAADADISLFHLGNNRLHEAIYARSLSTPGLVVLHDALLQHFMLGTMQHDQYVAEWVHNYGEWRRELGERLWRDRARAAVDPRYFSYPMLRRAMETSRGVIVHNPGAAARALEHGAKKIFTIPHFAVVENPPDAGDVARFRERIGVAAGDTLYGIFGYLREPKRIASSLAAFKRLNAARPATKLLLAGECVSPDLQRMLDVESKHPGIRRIGHLSDTDLKHAIAAVACGINLRYPGAGESSGISMHLMAAGKPVIVTDNAENSAFPTDTVLRVSSGIAETAELFDYMVVVNDFPSTARAVGERAREYIREKHSLQAVAGQYWEALCTVAS